jgi:hypothetical protein
MNISPQKPLILRSGASAPRREGWAAGAVHAADPSRRAPPSEGRRRAPQDEGGLCFQLFKGHGEALKAKPGEGGHD